MRTEAASSGVFHIYYSYTNGEILSRVKAVEQQFGRTGRDIDARCRQLFIPLEAPEAADPDSEQGFFPDAQFKVRGNRNTSETTPEDPERGSRFRPRGEPTGWLLSCREGLFLQLLLNPNENIGLEST